MGGGRLQCLGLHKSYGDVPAVLGIDLDIAPGEFFSLLGPSGCGKTSTLRMIAGFEPVDQGSVLIDSIDITMAPAQERPVNTVFQNYALFPFLSVAENVGFGLRYQKASRAEITRRVGEALELVRMSSFAQRRPGQLSGGQQQRVALARAIVMQPQVLLLDEPLGALDAKLRTSLQVELKSLQESLGITFVYVTHDQQEALTMSDRMAVMAAGRIEQVGTPSEIYESPTSAYVADFLGSANVLEVEVIGPAGAGMTMVGIGGQRIACSSAPLDSGPVRLVVRPERLLLESTAEVAGTLQGTVVRTIYQGSTTEVVVALPGGSEIVVRRSSESGIQHRAGDPVTVHCPPGALRLLPPGALG